MKYLFFIVFLLSQASTLSAQSYYLVPGRFYSEKGQTTDIGVFYGKSVDTLHAKRTELSALTTAVMYGGGKPVNLLPDNASSATPSVLQIQGQGLCLVAAKKDSVKRETDSEEFSEELEETGFADLAGKLAEEEEITINNSFFAKTLFMTGKPSGGTYEEKTGDALEIILLHNPYKMKYGEDVAAQVLFKGKPLAKVRAEVITRTLNGSLIPTEYTTDEEGKFYIKLNRSGDWFLRVVHVAQGSTPVIYDRWYASYSFGFRS